MNGALISHHTFTVHQRANKTTTGFPPRYLNVGLLGTIPMWEVDFHFMILTRMLLLIHPFAGLSGELLVRLTTSSALCSSTSELSINISTFLSTLKTTPQSPPWEKQSPWTTSVTLHPNPIQKTQQSQVVDARLQRSKAQSYRSTTSSRPHPCGCWCSCYVEGARTEMHEGLVVILFCMLPFKGGLTWTRSTVGKEGQSWENWQQMKLLRQPMTLGLTLSLQMAVPLVTLVLRSHLA